MVVLTYLEFDDTALQLSLIVLDINFYVESVAVFKQCSACVSPHSVSDISVQKSAVK